jgi:anti-sigma B factor antagonist
VPSQNALAVAKRCESVQHSDPRRVPSLTLKTLLPLSGSGAFSLCYLDRSPSRSYTSLVWLEILKFPPQNMSPVVKIIQPSGILDGTKASQFRQEISDLVEAGADVVLIDFTDVTFMDSSGLGALVLALKTVRAAGSQLVVCSINEQIRILFELTSMDRVFEIFQTRDAFNSKILSTN